jgi:CheY-like chemotaxis protein
MRVLLIEDEDPKRRHILAEFRRIVADASVAVAKSVTSALDAIERERPDLLLLDMSLPTFDISDQEDGGRPQGFGGIEILRYLDLQEVRVPTIVITGYEAFPKAGGQLDLEGLRKELEKDFPDIFLGLLHYNSSLEEWKHELTEAFKKLSGGRL